MTEILQKNYFSRVECSSAGAPLAGMHEALVESQARCKPRVVAHACNSSYSRSRRIRSSCHTWLQSQFAASLGYIRKDSKSQRETSLFIFTFASSASQKKTNNNNKETNKQKTVQLKTQRSLTNAFKRLMKTGMGACWQS